MLLNPRRPIRGAAFDGVLTVFLALFMAQAPPSLSVDRGR